MLQLAGLGDASDDFNFCEMNPDDEVCVAYAEANEIDMPADCARRGGCDDVATAGMQDVIVDGKASGGRSAKAGISWKTLGAVVGVVAGLGAIGYVVARR
jgi:hypothetical protein